MAHIRQQIRAAVVTAVTGLTTTGSRVFNARTHILEAGNLPGLVVFVGHEAEPEVIEGQTLEGATTQQDRRGVIVVEGYAKGAAIANTLDTIAAEVETAMEATDFSALLKTYQLTRTEFDYQAEAAADHGVIRLFYLIQYRTDAADPTVAR